MNDIPLAIILPNTIERPLTGIPFRIPFNGIPLAIILPNTIERPLIGIPLAIILPNTIERPLTGVPFNSIPLAIILYYQIPLKDRWPVYHSESHWPIYYQIPFNGISMVFQADFFVRDTCAQSVNISPTEPVLSRSSRQRLGHLQSHFDGGWHVCQTVFHEPQSAAARRRVERRDCNFREFNLVATGRWWNSWCEEGRYRPVAVHCPSSLVWGSPRWFGSRRVGPGSACARV